MYKFYNQIIYKVPLQPDTIDSADVFGIFQKDFFLFRSAWFVFCERRHARPRIPPAARAHVRTRVRPTVKL